MADEIWHIATCVDCEMAQPFRNAQKCAEWGAEHFVGTGHSVTLTVAFRTVPAYVSATEAG